MMLIENFKQFALAGKAKFSIEISGERFKYFISKKTGIWFVYCEGKYLLTLHNDNIFLAKSEFSFLAKEYKAFEFIWKLALIKKNDERVTIQHEGICSMCSRKLTDEVSVELGIGPECRKKL